MAFNGSDVIALERAGTLYKTTGTELLNFILANTGTGQYEVANIAARNALTNLSLGDRIFVTDATGDATVGAGWAIYIYRSPGVFTKMAEQEGLDLVVSVTNLSYTAGANSGIVVSSDGADATIPAVNATDAGLMLPGDKAKVDRLTVTAATDLDAIRTASHAAVTTAGTATTNPLVVSAGQVLSFSISNLATAP